MLPVKPRRPKSLQNREHDCMIARIKHPTPEIVDVLECHTSLGHSDSTQEDRTGVSHDFDQSSIRFAGRIVLPACGSHAKYSTLNVEYVFGCHLQAVQRTDNIASLLQTCVWRFRSG